MLVENTLFGELDKVQIAIERLRMHAPPEGYYVAFSGGKDSIVVKDLVKRSGVKYDIHYNLTTVDPPELVYYIRQYHPDVEVCRPEKTMWQLIIQNHIPPLRTMRYCCSTLKEDGGKGRTVVTGVRWAESARRAKRQSFERCMRSGANKLYLHPIIEWSDTDVWEYIRRRNLPYCSLYDEGRHRIGCIMCPFTGPIGMRRDAARWPKYAAMYRWACQQAYNQSPTKYPTWQSGDDMYEWWISPPEKKVDPDQTAIFE